MGEQDGLVAPALRLLFEEGLQDQAYHLLSKPDDPGWGYMIAQGAETMWEGWDDIESHCHAWNGYPARLRGSMSAGFRAELPGSRRHKFAPFRAGSGLCRGFRFDRKRQDRRTLGASQRNRHPRGLSALHDERYRALASPSSRPITSLLVDGVEIWGGSASSCMPDGIVRAAWRIACLNLRLSGRYELTVRY